ncbi:hypothetical protein [Emticicia sp. BO119]|uniref:hypothetical protein n=1 Tax=Emticicia sp. BO119 TaxID=2757768 RepID=UPI0015F018F7|nr:hypothetical protein [Emticicia sp. BO119]MBA4854060.1 hypothetical protein [Emticicia sp. BO119]
MKTITIGGLLCLFIFNLSAQSSKKLSETVYRSFYNQTITIYPDNPDKMIKKRYGVFIDTTQNSVFAKNLIEKLMFDDYHESLIQRACRDFKASKKINELWSFRNDPLLSQLPKKWFEAQELNGTTYIFCPKVIKNHYSFSLTDSTVLVSKGLGPDTYFIKSIQNSANGIVIDCFQGVKFTIKILNEQTKLAIWKMENKSPDHTILYRLSVPFDSFSYYNMIVNHSAEEKIPDDLTFDEIDYEGILSMPSSLSVQSFLHSGNR